MNDLGNNKSPGPDGFTIEFFKKSWNTLKGDITGVLNGFFQNVTINTSLNETDICLIPKIVGAKTQKFLDASLIANEIIDE